MQLSASPLHTAILRARSMMILFLCFWFLGRFFHFWFWSGFGVMAWVSWRLGGCGVVVWNGLVEWKKQKWVCSSNGRVIPSQGIGNGIDARLIQLFVFLSEFHFVLMKSFILSQWRVALRKWNSSLTWSAFFSCFRFTAFVETSTAIAVQKSSEFGLETNGCVAQMVEWSLRKG